MRAAWLRTSRQQEMRTSGQGARSPLEPACCGRWIWLHCQGVIDWPLGPQWWAHCKNSRAADDFGKVGQEGLGLVQGQLIKQRSAHSFRLFLSFICVIYFSFLVGVCVCVFAERERRRGSGEHSLKTTHTRAHVHTHSHTFTLEFGC